MRLPLPDKSELAMTEKMDSRFRGNDINGMGMTEIEARMTNGSKNDKECA